MKKLAVVAFSIFAFVACKEDKKDTNTETTVVVNDTVEMDDKKNISRHVSEVIKVHGGMEKWDMMNNLCFTFNGNGGEEVHTVALKNRSEKIEHEKWSLGNDGSGVWLLENEEGAYKGNALFYNQLMFYFYAMPFVLADDGIIYTPMPAQELDGKKYNAVKIGYEDSVGYSPDDEYMLYTDPETNQMAWLGYTVTGKTHSKKFKWSFIKYDKWQEVNGLLLPEKITWYNVDNNKPTDERNDILFKNVTVTKTTLPASVFAKPEGAVMVTE